MDHLLLTLRSIGRRSVRATFTAADCRRHGLGKLLKMSKSVLSAMRVTVALGENDDRKGVVETCPS
jgi:hypothetical protein